MVIIYVIVSILALLGFCSLSVDLGRVMVAKTQLRIAADAAARAGVGALAALPPGSSTTTVVAAAQAIALKNQADGYAVTLAASDVIVGTWNTSTRTFSSGGTANNTTTYQAVQVTARRTKATNTAVPLLFAQILGAPTCDVTATTTAALVVVPGQRHTQFISAQSNIWLAGEPQGTLGSEPDTGYVSSAHPYKNDIAGDPNIAYGQPGGPGYAVGHKVASTDYNSQQLYNSILQFQLTVIPGSIIQLSSVSGTADNEGEFTNGTPTTGANGNDDGSYTFLSDDAANPSFTQGTETTSGSEHGISNIITPLNSVTGVFLDNNPADDSSDSNYSSPPPGLDFTTQAARDYTNLDPELAQSFYVGSGQTSNGTQQTIVVPANATRLYLGTMDGHEWSNNVGGFTATITQYQIATVQ
jgi:Flp pilus assembly protein TadG